MLKRYLIPTLLVLSIVVLASGCKKAEDKPARSEDKEMKTEMTKTPEKNEQTQTVTVEIIGPKEKEDVMPLPDPLSKAEAAKYTSDLSLAERKSLAEGLTVSRPKDGFNQLKAMFSDLKKVKSVPDSEKTNMLNMGTEEWYYSAEGGFTAVNCLMVNTPIYIFDKESPTDAEVMEGITEMKKMMSDEASKKKQ